MCCSISPHPWPMEVGDPTDSLLNLVEVMVPLNVEHGPSQIHEPVHVLVEHRVVMVKVHIVLGTHQVLRA